MGWGACQDFFGLYLYGYFPDRIGVEITGVVEGGVVDATTVT